MTRFRENPNWRKQWRQAVDAGLVRGALQVRDEVEERFASRNDGFLRGEFATGVAARSTQISRPYSRDGLRRIDIYNDARRYKEKTGGEHPYVLFWELGHVNEFLGDYVRVETYRPALLAAADEVVRLMKRQIRQHSKQKGVFSKGGGAQLAVELE